MHLDETFDVHVNNRCLFLCAALGLVSAYRVSIELCVGWLCVSLGWRDNSQLLKHREYFGGRGIARCPPLHNFSEHICDVAVYFGGGSIAHRPSSSHRRHALRREGKLPTSHVRRLFHGCAMAAASLGSLAGSSTFTALSPTRRRGVQEFLFSVRIGPHVRCLTCTSDVKLLSFKECKPPFSLHFGSAGSTRNSSKPSHNFPDARAVHTFFELDISRSIFGLFTKAVNSLPLLVLPLTRQRHGKQPT